MDYPTMPSPRPEERPSPWTAAGACEGSASAPAASAAGPFPLLAAALFAGGLSAFALLSPAAPPAGAPPAPEPHADAPAPRSPALVASTGWVTPPERPYLVAFVPEPAVPLADRLEDRRPDLAGLLAKAPPPAEETPAAAPAPARAALRPAARLRPLPSLSGFPVSGLEPRPAPAAPRPEGSASIEAPRPALPCPECGNAVPSSRLGRRYVALLPGSARVRVRFRDLGRCAGRRLYGVTRADGERASDLVITADTGESWQVRGLRQGEVRRILADRPISGMNVDDL
ncbi:MAG: hypothetical protein HY554_04580 [Elusimicrobia bacterium]|nr:hypothetical protein [Elusimicrobiota bacterium]